MYGDYAVAEPRIRGRVPPPQLGVAPVVISAAGSVVSSLFGRKPPSAADVARFSADIEWAITDAASRGDWRTIQAIAEGGTVPAGALRKRAGGTYGAANFSDGKPERAAEIRYAAELLAQRLASAAVTPSVLDVTDRTRPGGVAAPLPGGVPQLPGTTAAVPTSAATVMRAGLSGSTALLGAAGLIGAALMMRQAKPRRNPPRRRGRRRTRRRR